jgi:inorganic pyrophosphatase
MPSINVVIETPKGSAQKYDYDPATHFFKLKKILPTGMMFPYDFGFVPDTRGEDGDPLDVIVISEFNSFPGCLIECKIIGGIKAEQSAEGGKHSKKMIRNDRFLAIPKCSNIFENIKTISDLPKTIIEELESFFVDYNKIEGKDFKAIKILEPKEAIKMIMGNQEKNYASI